MDTLRVATLNIWNRSGPWEARLKLIRREVASLELDVLGLQEVLRSSDHADGTWKAPEKLSPDSDQASAVAAGHGLFVAYGHASALGDGVFFGNALLSRFPVVEHRVFPLPGETTGETRSCLYARLDHPGGSLPVFVTHLNWKLHHGSTRLQQVKCIVDQVMKLAPIEDASLPPVLMGDFNAEPESDEMRYLRGLATVDGRSVYFADAWIYAGEGPGYTFDRKNCFAARAHEPPRRIDYIYVRGPDRRLRGEPLVTRLAFDQVETGPDGDVWPSDHFGLVTELAVSPRSLP